MLVTSLDDVTPGKYVLYGVNGNYVGAMSSVCNKGHMLAAEVTLSGSTVVDPDESVIWVMSDRGDGSYSLYNEAAEQYCMITTDSTGGFTVGEEATEGFTVSVHDEEKGTFYLTTTLEDSGRTISLYQADFRPYNQNDSKDLYLYKYVGGDDPQPVTHTVTFVDGLTNETISTVTVENGQAATAPDAPVHEGYTFTGWDKDFSAVTEDMTVTALYTENGPSVTLLGDIDLDGEVTASDALLAMRHAMSITTVSGQGAINGDMDGDGVITASDAILIMRAVMAMD